MGDCRRKTLIVAIIIAIFMLGGLMMIDYARRAEVVDTERTAWLKSTLIVHKGLHDERENVPENTLPAFAHAVLKGYVIELDVSMTKDKRLVVFHDKKLKRMLGIDRYLKDVEYDEFASIKLLNSNEIVPLLSEVLALVKGKVPLLIEVKNEGQVGEMESLLYNELKNYQGKYAIQSFNPYTLQWFRQNDPSILRGQLAGSFIISDYEVEYAGTTRLPWPKKIVLKNLLLNFASRPNFIAYEIADTDNKTAKSLKKLGVPILGWTIKDKEEYEKFNNMFDNLIVDTVDL